MNPAVSEDILEQIQHQLDAVESDNEVILLYACESGSRAWGFPSTDSDYDVRFLYARRPEWYLSIDIAMRRDVIELPIESDLDIKGWDISKTLRLYRRSNPHLFEWLVSPIVYRDYHDFAKTLRALSDQFYRPKNAAYHYARMAQKSWHAYLQRSEVLTKEYLYTLRPTLAVLWMERELGVVPTEFAKLVSAVVDDSGVREAIDDLLVQKAAGTEAMSIKPIASLHAFLSEHMERVDAVASGIVPEPRGAIAPLNDLFRSCLSAAWGT
jgi:predicted nucleotidyltransferase